MPRNNSSESFPVHKATRYRTAIWITTWRMLL